MDSEDSIWQDSYDKRISLTKHYSYLLHEFNKLSKINVLTLGGEYFLSEQLLSQLIKDKEVYYVSCERDPEKKYNALENVEVLNLEYAEKKIPHEVEVSRHSTIEELLQYSQNDIEYDYINYDSMAIISKKNFKFFDILFNRKNNPKTFFLTYTQMAKRENKPAQMFIENILTKYNSSSYTYMELMYPESNPLEQLRRNATACYIDTAAKLYGYKSQHILFTTYTGQYNTRVNVYTYQFTKLET